MSVFNIPKAMITTLGGPAGKGGTVLGTGTTASGGPGTIPVTDFVTANAGSNKGPAAGTGTATIGKANVEVTQQGVFVTPQTIASFAGATLAVTLMWDVSGVIWPGAQDKPLVGLVASVIVGAALYYISESDPARGTVTSRDRAIGIFVALINTLVIFSAATGTDSMTSSNGTTAADNGVTANVEAPAN